MTLAELSIKRPVFAWMLMLGVILFGLISFTRLGVSYLPDIDYPTININVNWSGAAPEVMESEIVDPIEERIVAVEGIRQMSSNISQGTANITLEFDPKRNVDATIQEVQAYLQQVRLPQDVPVPTIRKTNPEDNPILRVAVYGRFSVRDLADYVDKYLQTPLQISPGVGEVSISGFGTRSLRIWVDNEKLKAYELTTRDILNAIENQHQEMAGGYVENEEKMYNVRTLGEGNTTQQVGDILILSRGGGAIYDSKIHIRDVARVEDGLSNTTSIARFDHQPAIFLNIKKQRGFNEVEVADNLTAELNVLKKNLPPNMHADLVVDFTRFTKRAVDQTEHELLVAIILTSIICFLFLGTWSSSVNVLMAIPFSMAGAFCALYAFHFTLNLFTLLALALAIGIVVDDAIMVLENIVRHFQMGKKKKRASLDGSREITFAAMAASVAVAAIFLPVAFMQGVIGYFFFQFGVTITVAVLFSLLEAITLTPMRCSQMLTAADPRNRLVQTSDWIFKDLAARYRTTLNWALQRRILIMVISTAIFFGSMGAFSYLRQEFVPPQDQNFFTIGLETPIGSSIYYTDEKMKLVEAYLSKIPEVSHFLGNTTGNRGNFDVVLKPKAKRTRSQTEIMQTCREQIKLQPGLEKPVVKFWFGDLSGRGLSSGLPSPVSCSIRGPEYETLTKVSNQILQDLNATGLVTDMNTNYRSGMPEVEIIPDREAAGVRGVSIDSIGQTVSSAIGGVLGGKFTSGGHRYDVLIQLEPQDRAKLEDIRQLQIRTGYGELIPLSDVTRLVQHASLLNFARIDRERAVRLFGNLAPGVSQSEALAKLEEISRKHLPPNYQFFLDGNAQNYKDAFSGLWFALMLGMAVAYMVLASQFNSFLHPISVLLALPFSLTGAILALFITHQSLNLFSMIGIILLMGIAKKNSILLVEFTNHVRHNHQGTVRESLLEACPIRLRPILMTSIATISSAIPSALGFGPGSETRVPMAIAVIGGLLISTLFTLYVVPCAYSLFAPLERSLQEEDLSD